MRVFIENSVPGESAFLRLVKAQRLVKAGRARWTGETRIKLTKLTDEQIDKTNQFHAKVRGYDYDVSRNRANRKQIAGLPCVKPEVLLYGR